MTDPGDDAAERDTLMDDRRLSLKPEPSEPPPVFWAVIGLFVAAAFAALLALR